MSQIIRTTVADFTVPSGIVVDVAASDVVTTPTVGDGALELLAVTLQELVFETSTTGNGNAMPFIMDLLNIEAEASGTKTGDTTVALVSEGSTSGNGSLKTEGVLGEPSATDTQRSIQPA